MAQRKNRLVIMLRDGERKSIDRWAKRERLPTATAARRILLDQAEKTSTREQAEQDNGR